MPLPDEHKLRHLRDNVKRQVDMYAERGISRPQTPLEHAAFEQGRLSVLNWLLGEEQAVTNPPAAKKAKS